MKLAVPSLVVAAFALPLAAHAESATRPPDNPAPAASDQPIVLSEFDVKSTKDTAYRVENAVATTGVAQRLLDTPLPITVVTNEFLRDNNLEGFSDALKYTSSISFDPHTGNGNYAPGAGRGNSQPNGITFRGQPYNGTFRNGLKLQVGFATENVDRIEVAKGPMAVFVGGATLGGEVNVITRKPEFYTHNEVRLEAGSHDSYRASIDLTGPLSRTVAYRLIVDYADGNTWRDWSHSRTLFVDPQVTWRPFDKLSMRVEAYHRVSEGNLVSQNVSSTQNYQAAYDSPPQALLDIGKRRTSGPNAGKPYSVAEYRARIGQGFGNWRQDVFDTTGTWVALGTGEGLLEGDAPDGRRYNWYGPNAHYREPVTLVENENTLAATPWLEVHAIERYMKSDVKQDFYSFGQRRYASGNYPLDFGGATRVGDEFRDAKLEAVLKHSFGRWVSTKLLLGGQYSSKEEYAEDATFDYSHVTPVAPSPNVSTDAIDPATGTIALPGSSAYVLNASGLLAGQAVFHYFDPRTMAFPDTRAITVWPTQTKGPGQFAYSYTYNLSRAFYSAASLGFWDDRLLLTGGLRRDQAYALTKQADPAKHTVAGSVSTQSVPTTQSYMYGGTLRIVQGLNAYASYSRGETARTGSLVSRVPFGVSPPDIVTPAEAAAHPVPNSLGIGKEGGFKFEITSKLSGSIGWFQLAQGGILIPDTVRTGNDPRNVGTEVDPNPATLNAGVRARVQWSTGVSGNISEGYESDLMWTPIPSYVLVVGATHLTKNLLTVPKPPTNDPVLLRDYTLLTGRPLDRSPDDIFRVYQRYTFLHGALRGASVALGVSHQSSMAAQPSNSAWGVVYPSWTVADVVLGYETHHWRKPVNFVLSITNATNTTYFLGQRMFGAPREFTLSTRVQF